MSRRIDSQNVPPRVVLVDTSRPVQVGSCAPKELGSQLPYAERSAGGKVLQPGLKGWLDDVLLPILVGDILSDNSGEFNSRGLYDALRYLRALFFKPAVA